MNRTNSPRKYPGKRFLSALGGALVGYASISLFMASGLGYSVARLGVGPLVLAGSGLIYLMMAAIVGVGALFPAVGTKFLNVADREDLDDQRTALLAGTASFILLSVMQFVLAFAGPGGTIADIGAIALCLGALAAVTAISLRQWQQNDELMRQTSWEGAGFALMILSVFLAIWAGGRLFAGLPALDPHVLFAALFQSLLVGTFVATGLRGLLQQN